VAEKKSRILLNIPKKIMFKIISLDTKKVYVQNRQFGGNSGSSSRPGDSGWMKNLPLCMVWIK
jgi:hypothetical protein